METETHVLETSYALSAYDRMLVCLWNGSVTGERVQGVVDHCRRHCVKYPDGAGFMLVIGPSTGLPSTAVRSDVVRAFAEMQRYVHSAAIVILGSGFNGSIARSVISVMFLAMPGAMKKKVFSDVPSAVTWQVMHQTAGSRVAEPAYLAATQTFIDAFRAARKRGPVSVSPQMAKD